MSFHEGILVGCDQNQQWLLPWWWAHYSAQNSYPVVFIDFGMSKQALTWCQKRGTILCVNKRATPVLFKKPLALLKSPFQRSLWVDLDCQIKGSLEPLLNCLGFGAPIGLVKEDLQIHQLGMEQGHLLPGEANYNSGVIAFQKGAAILRQWKEILFQKGAKKFPDDQYALARAIHIHKTAMVELPSIFNWPNDHGPEPRALIIHFHGPHGKIEILNSLKTNEKLLKDCLGIR